MTIQSESELTALSIEMASGKSYLRVGDGDWWEFVGNSLEALWYTEEEKLEKMHQEYIKQKDLSPKLKEYLNCDWESAKEKE